MTFIRVLAAAVMLAFASPAAIARNCPDLPPCTGCGCRGGPGYRGPNGHCVSYRDLDRVCGPNPASRCVFENLPNTGLNRECTGHAS